MDRSIIRRLIAPILCSFAFAAMWVFSASADAPAPIIPGAVDNVPAEVESAAAQALGDYPPIITATHYAFTNISYPASNYYMLSTVGLTSADEWNLMDDPIWYGTVIVYSDTVTASAGVLGTITYTNMISDAFGGNDTVEVMGLTEQLASAEMPFFPWLAGTNAYYANYYADGLHGGCIGLDGDYGIDWFGGAIYDSMPNMVYASASGTVTRVCNDGTTIGLVIGDYGYLHFLANDRIASGFSEGDYIYRGRQLGSLKTGTFSDVCGYAEQSTTSYHVHWCFVPNNGYLSVEKWTLNAVQGSSNYGDWLKGSQRVSPGQYMLALWDGTNPVYTPTPTITPGGPTLTPTPYGTPAPTSPPTEPTPEAGGASFWDPIVYGVWYLVADLLGGVPDHNEIGLATTFLSAAGTVLRVSLILLNSNFNLGVPFFAIGVMLVMESWRIVTAVGRRVMEFIGYILKFIPFLG